MLVKVLPFVHRFIELMLKKGISLMQVIIYGSMVDGSASPESDVDLMVFIKNKSDKERVVNIEDQVNKEIMKEGFKFYISANISTKVSLDHIRDGILVWGTPILVRAKKENLIQKHVVTYSTDKLKQTERAELSRRLLGYNINNKYVFGGILEDLNAKRLRNAILCTDSSSIIEILKSYEQIKVEDSIVYVPEHVGFVEKEIKNKIKKIK